MVVSILSSMYLLFVRSTSCQLLEGYIKINSIAHRAFKAQSYLKINKTLAALLKHWLHEEYNFIFNNITAPNQRKVVTSAKTNILATDYSYRGHFNISIKQKQSAD